jgi:DNA-directed RNA polymerase subunit K/omega
VLAVRDRKGRAGFVDDDAFLLHGFSERDEAASVESICPAQEKDAEVFVGEWAVDGNGF